MNDKSLIIKDIIEYLTDVYDNKDDVFDNKKIGGKSQYIFMTIPQLNKVLNKYFIRFENKDELNKAVKFNLETIKRFSFQKGEKGCKIINDPSQKGEDGFQTIRDLTIPNNVPYPMAWHNNYSHVIHSHLIKAFEEKLGVKKAKEKKRITLKRKKVYGLVKILNLKFDFLKNDSLPKDFINVLIGTSEKEIHLNVNNQNFHYLLTKIKEYFFNFTITAVAETNKIRSKKGTLLKANNLINANVDFPSLKDSIDEVFKNFK